MTQTTITYLPNGEKGVIGSPAHRLLQRMAADVTGWVSRGKGATDTQLRALARDNHVTLVHDHEGRRLIIRGAYLTPRGERYVELLDAAEARAGELANA